jgi:hypothetical protein|tara:strand:- start:251 stop:505 length:255 start_codon:yes stop_codon:yes gene_type:complete
MEVELVNGTLTKSIGVNEDGETEITVESSGTGNHSMMNQTIVVEAKPLESVEAFGVKAESSNILFALVAVIAVIACWKLLKKWF